jgi:Salmonella virulence plasmid 65kDa B protein
VVAFHSVHRAPEQDGVGRLYSDKYFTSSLGGELSTTTSVSEFQHRFEDGRIIEYTFSNNSWIAYDKKGTKHTFGASTTAQLYATTSPSNVYRWRLEEIRDTNDNYIRYEYVRDTSTNQIFDGFSP